MEHDGEKQHTEQQQALLDAIHRDQQTLCRLPIGHAGAEFYMSRIDTNWEAFEKLRTGGDTK